LYQGETEVVDANGFKTGEHSASYSEPVEAQMNVSGGRGTAAVQFFGIENPFTRSAVTEDLTTPFDDTTVFWFGKKPGENADDYNYICTGVATTINGRVIALREVDVSDGE
jgi:hypothetical protein